MHGRGEHGRDAGHWGAEARLRRGIAPSKDGGLFLPGMARKRRTVKGDGTGIVDNGDGVCDAAALLDKAAVEA